MTARDAAAPDLAAVLTLAAPRSDDPLEGVTVPVARAAAAAAVPISHLEEVHADLVSRLPVPDRAGGSHHRMPVLRSSADAKAYIDTRVAAWEAARKAR